LGAATIERHDLAAKCVLKPLGGSTIPFITPLPVECLEVEPCVMISRVSWISGVGGPDRADRGPTDASRARRRLASTAAASVLLFGLTACASGGAGSGAGIANLPPPDATSVPSAAAGDYRIGPQDTLEIAVFQVENLTRTLQVDTSGQIDFPLLGAVTAAGKTTAELAEEMSRGLGQRYLQAPHVSVFVRQSVSRRFTVEGAVGRPGVFDMTGRMTLLQAIATAQGVAPAAKLRQIVVFRTIDQQRMAAIADLKEIRTGRLPDPEIYPGDVIVVPASESGRMLRAIIGATPIFSLLAM
jgi:polysaccharide export outer membrane protein